MLSLVTPPKSSSTTSACSEPLEVPNQSCEEAIKTESSCSSTNVSPDSPPKEHSQAHSDEISLVDDAQKVW